MLRLPEGFLPHRLELTVTPAGKKAPEPVQAVAVVTAGWEEREIAALQPGVRVRVPFGRRVVTAYLLEVLPAYRGQGIGIELVRPMLAQLGAPSTVGIATGDYAFADGTSMATPHVAGVAALVWSQDASCSNQDIRDVLGTTATDLGAPGRDNVFAQGLV